MKYSAALTLASIAIGVQAQGVPNGIAPPGGSPPGCQLTASGRYEVQNVKAGPTKRSLEKRLVDCSDPKNLVVTLKDGILTDAAGRIGEIVANRQFQFDGPPAQTGSIYTGGWSLCGNMSLAIGPSTNFYQCLSGGFYNIYDQPVGAQCVPIHQQLLQCADSGSTPPSSASSASTSVAVSTPSTPATSTTVVSQATDGQPQATSAVVSQATDGQPQATSPANTTVTTKAPIPTGGAAQFAASGAVVVLGAAAAFFL